MPQNLLEQLRKFTIIVADTGDIEAIGKFRPQDSTTKIGGARSSKRAIQEIHRNAASIQSSQRRTESDNVDLFQRKVQRFSQILSTLKILVIEVAITIVFFVWVYHHICQEIAK